MKKYDDVKNYWVEKGRGDGSTLPDFNLRDLEIAFISRFLKKNDICIDIGCGNGFSTKEFSKIVKKIIGADYSETMIANAKKRFSAPNADYDVVDIRDMPYRKNSFNKVITERCLINLTAKEEQLRAIHNVWKILRPGGLYIMCESFEQSFQRFNEMRKKWGLHEIKRHWHSLLMDEKMVKKPPGFELVDKLNFGAFYFVSRIVHPLMIHPEEPKYETNINVIAVKLALAYQFNEFDRFSTNKILVFKKLGGAGEN